MDVQVVSSQGQNGSVKTDGAFLPRILLSGFLLVSVMGESAFPGLQTSVRRRTSLVYSVPRAATLRCRHSHCTGLRSRAGDLCGSSKPRLGGELSLFALRAAVPRCWRNRCAGAPRLFYTWKFPHSVGNKDPSGNAALTHPPRVHRELQSWVVLTAPS